MCIIIDASVAATFFTEPFRGDNAPVANWITNGYGTLVYGGRLSTELFKIAAARRLIQNWARAGRAMEVADDVIDQQLAAVRQLNLCRSNDHHVIALARCSPARVLYTSDKALMSDFANVGLLPVPKGKIYRTASHVWLLGYGSCGCRSAYGRVRK